MDTVKQYHRCQEYHFAVLFSAYNEVHERIWKKTVRKNMRPSYYSNHVCRYDMCLYRSLLPSNRPNLPSMRWVRMFADINFKFLLYNRLDCFYQGFNWQLSTFWTAFCRKRSNIAVCIGIVKNWRSQNFPLKPIFVHFRTQNPSK